MADVTIWGKDFFDLVYIITVLQEIPERQKALKEIYRVLKPDGIIAVSEAYQTKAGCLNGIRSVKENSANSEIYDLSE